MYKTYFSKLPNKTLYLGILGYRLVISPSVGILRFLPFYPRPSCVFYPTCSEYALLVLEKEQFFPAIRKILKRIGRCHPGTDPQVDMP